MNNTSYLVALIPLIGRPPFIIPDKLCINSFHKVSHICCFTLHWTSLFQSGIALAVGLLVKLQYPMKAGKDIDVSLSTHRTVPHLLTQTNLDQWPVLVLIEQDRCVKITRIYNGNVGFEYHQKTRWCFYWGFLRHYYKENVYIESFLVESWVEHLRQHERMTIAVRPIQKACLGISYLFMNTEGLALYCRFLPRW
jgi:hypothetical protein